MAPPRPMIVCAVDDSPRARRVAAFAARFAKAVGARVVLAHVFDPMMIPAPSSREEQPLDAIEAVEEHERRRARDALFGAATDLGDVEHATVLAEGRPTDAILRLAREHAARLLVLGSAARKPLERLVQGSTAGEIAARATWPAVVVTDDADLDLDGPVLAAYDGSQHSLQAARHGAMLASALGRDLVLVHAAEPDGPGVAADAELARELHQAARSCAASVGRAARPLDVTVAVERGEPVERLTRAARERAVSLLVVGSRGRNALKAALLGSVSAGVIRAARRPVVVVGPAAGRDR